MNIRLENLSREVENKFVGDKPIVSISNVNAEIPSGKIVGLMGPSFSGKSSLLFMISGLFESTGGSIYFGDTDVTNIPAEKRDVGFVFQDYQLYPHLTVLQNIMFPLLVKKESKKVAKEKAMAIAETMGLTKLLNKKPRTLLSHQKILVAIARAYVKSPNIVLLDEPLSNLDIRFKSQTRDLIKKIQKETNITTIFVSQNQEDTIYVSDYLLLMSEGIVKAFGTPEELYSNPENQFVAEFLGDPSINIIQCVYNEDEESLAKAEKLSKEEALYDLNEDDSEEVREEIVTTTDTVEEVNEEPKEGNKIEAEVPKGILSFGDQIFVDDKTPEFGERMILTKDTRLAVRPEAFDFDPNGKYVMHIESYEFTGRDNLVRFTLPGLDTVFNCLAPLELNITPGEDIKFNFKRYFIVDIIGRRIK